MSKKPQMSFCHCQDLCALQPQHLADCDLDKLRVIKGGVLPKDAVDLMSPSVAEVLRHPRSSVLSCYISRSLRVPSRRTGNPTPAQRTRLPRMGGARPRVVRVSPGHLVHIFS